MMNPISRRMLLRSAPLLLAPRLALAAPVATPAQTEGPFYPAKLPADIDSDLVRIEGAVREAGGEILHLAGTVRDLADRAHVVDGAEHVARTPDAHEPRARREERGQRLERELVALAVELEPAHRERVVARDREPRRDVRVVLHAREDDLVPGAEAADGADAGVR